MNLVQINERLKDLPMQVLQQYANGMNPEVPPYLALGELQRREMTQKQAAAAQGGQQGPQPSIKEQVEQKAGLMALQQMQQQQAAQQMQQPRGPMPAPAGVPQPEAQPEAMARGGLAGIPVRRDMFEYAGGGIIAFQSGGQSLNERAARQMEEKGSIYDPYFGLPAQERERMKQEAALKAAQDRSSQSMAVTESNAQALAREAQARVNELESNREALIRQYGPRQYEQALAKAKQAIAAASSRGSELMAQQSQMGQSMVEEATPPQQTESAKLTTYYDGKNTYTSNSPLAGQIGHSFQYDDPKEGGKQVTRGATQSDASWNAYRRKYGAKDLPTSQGPGDVFAPRYPQAGLPAAAKAKATPVAGAAQPTAVPRPTAPRPAATSPATTTQAGLPAALAGTPAAASIPVAPDRAELEALMKSQKRQAPTAQGIIGDVNALMPEGMQEEAMKRRFADQRARAEARQAAYDKSKPSGLDDLIRVFGQAGQYKGLSGLAPAYTANQQQRRAEDLAMQKQQDELMTAIEGREYGADKDVFTARTGAMDKAQTLFGQSEKSILDAAAKKLEAEQGRLDKQAQLNMQRDLEQFKAIQDRELKTMDIDQRERESKRTDARSPAARAAEYVALKQKARDLRDKGQVAQADRLDAQAADMATIAGSGTAGVGAVRNAISERRLEMAGLEKIMKDEAMVYSDEEKREAAKEYRRLALLNSKESGGSPAGEVDKTNPLLK